MGKDPKVHTTGSTHPSALPIEAAEISRIDNRISFLYFEHCKISQTDNAITVIDDEGILRIPTASLSVLMLGPGTSISHRAMCAIGDMGVTVVWVGERGVRMYAAGRALTRSSGLLQRQATLVSNRNTRLTVARKMYAMRFPGENVSDLTMQQLRGREGARIRRVYRELSCSTGVKWTRREFDPDNYDEGTPINQALSAAHSCLYGLCHAVIAALGMSAGLGFIHTGHDLSFIYDIADLYKAEISIPIAFKAVAEGALDIGQAVRRTMRDVMYEKRLTEIIVSDLKYLMEYDDTEQKVSSLEDHVGLWDERLGEVCAGKQYGKE